MQKVLEAIIKLESRTADELDTLQDELSSSTKTLRADREKLYKRRQELVTGKSSPNREELQNWHGSSDTDGHAGSSIKGVPYFWVTVLGNQDTIAEELSSRDKQALSYCTGMRATYPAAGGPPTLEMSFSSNPFFSNSVLKRCLGDAEAGVKEATTDIQWKDTAHKLTVKEVIKKSGGKKGKGKGKAKGADEAEPAAKAKYKACSSFFSFFLPDTSSSSSRSTSSKHMDDPTLPYGPEASDDEEAEEPVKSAKQERDELLMAVLLEHVLPQAATLYMAGPLQVPSDEDDEEGDFQLVHGPVGGSPQDLPGPVQMVLAALQHNQAQLDALQEQWQQLRSKVKAQQSKLRAKLFSERKALLLRDGDSQAVPRFWLRVLKSADAAALAISPRDAAVLAALADVRFSMDSSADGTELHGRWELEFLPNPFLVQPEAAAAASSSTTVLVKSYTFEQGPEGDRLLQSKVVTAPQWSSSTQDPTHRLAKDGKQRPAASIFQLFKQGGGKYAFNLTGDAKDVQAEANDLETELLQELYGHLLLKAGQVYQQLEGEGWHEDDNPAGDKAAWEAASTSQDDVESEEEDVSEDEGEAAHRAAVRRSKQRHSWKPTKAELLIILVVMMLLGELFVFLDIVGLFGRRSG